MSSESEESGELEENAKGKMENLEEQLENSKEQLENSKEQLEKICKAIQKQNLNIKLQKNKIIVEFSNDEEVERFSKILPNISF